MLTHQCIGIGITEWLPGWKNNNYRRSNGQPVLNLALIRYLDALINARERAGQKVCVKHLADCIASNEVGFR